MNFFITSMANLAELDAEKRTRSLEEGPVVRSQEVLQSLVVEDPLDHHPPDSRALRVPSDAGAVLVEVSRDQLLHGVKVVGAEDAHKVAHQRLEWIGVGS